jgi:ELWxxDGT repeat protein
MKIFGFSALFISIAMIFAENTNASTSNKIETCRNETEIHVYNGNTYFCGIHKYLGEEVFRKNGDKHEAVLLKDIDSGPGGSSPQAFFNLGDYLYFVAETTQTRWALWRTDGTEKGTELIRTIASHSAFDNGYFSIYREIIKENNGEVFFQLDDKLWRTDGTSAGTYKIDAPVSFDHFVKLTSYFYANDGLYFTARSSLYKIPKNSRNSYLVKQFLAHPHHLGRDTDLVEIVEDSYSNGSFSILVRFDYGSKQALWRSNGTSSGTEKIGENIYDYMQFGTKGVYCEPGTVDIKIISNSGLIDTLASKVASYCSMQKLDVLNGKLIFKLFDSGGSNNGTWSTRGTKASTARLTSRSGDAKDSLIFEGKIYTTTSNDSELWKSTGEPSAGAQTVKSTYNNYYFGGVFSSNIGVFFSMVGKSDRKDQLWLDNNTSSPQLISTLPGGGYIKASSPLGVYFKDSTRILWFSNGTTSGTRPVYYLTDIDSNAENDKTNIITPVVNLLLDEEEKKE